MELDNSTEDSETREQRNVSATPNVPGLIHPIRQTKKKVENVLMTVTISKTRRNTGIKKMSDRM